MSSIEASSVPGEDSNVVRDTPLHDRIDVVGVPGPFAVIESDPDVFTTLLRTLGVTGHEVVEIPEIAPWALEPLNPKGLIFCYLWKKEGFRRYPFDDPDAANVWFAEQLVDDACASLAMLNVVLNAPNMNIGPALTEFRADTKEMSSAVNSAFAPRTVPVNDILL